MRAVGIVVVLAACSSTTDGIDLCEHGLTLTVELQSPVKIDRLVMYVDPGTAAMPPIFTPQSAVTGILPAGWDSTVVDFAVPVQSYEYTHIQPPQHGCDPTRGAPYFGAVGIRDLDGVFVAVNATNVDDITYEADEGDGLACFAQKSVTLVPL